MEQIDECFVASAHKNSVVQLRGFFDGTTPESVAELLWAKLGINVSPTCISISPHRTPFVTLILDRACLADFLSRALQQAGERIVAYPSAFGLRSNQHVRKN